MNIYSTDEYARACARVKMALDHPDLTMTTNSESEAGKRKRLRNRDRIKYEHKSTKYIEITST